MKHNTAHKSIHLVDEKIEAQLKSDLKMLLDKSMALRGVPRASCRVWVPDFVQERFHNMSLGDYDDAFIKSGDSETRKGLA